jgi:hypothetical protein
MPKASRAGAKSSGADAWEDDNFWRGEFNEDFASQFPQIFQRAKMQLDG